MAKRRPIPGLFWAPTAVVASAALTAIMLLTAAPAETTERIDNTHIIKNFDVVAFGNEYTGRRYRHVRKWAEPIRIGIEGRDYPPYFEAMVRSHIRDLWQITRHPIELYYSFALQKAGRLAPDFDPRKVNFILFHLNAGQIPAAIGKYFNGNQSEVGEMMRKSTCFAKFGTQESEIRWAIAVFPAHHPREVMRACIVEELTQVMGLPNDSGEVRPSIFNDTSRFRELTSHDRWMLAMLYDRRITHGMPRTQALDLGRKILDEMRPH